MKIENEIISRLRKFTKSLEEGTVNENFKITRIFHDFCISCDGKGHFDEKWKPSDNKNHRKCLVCCGKGKIFYSRSNK